ncbi:class I SAM-dependent methyltransferase [Porifericola rhodea]|uniref:class I SAM-dependent methyltransferase n=1 Tax=Porifericola rhodea TaxID=930972 RepID=UPI002666CF9B|nr:class I SAM-dependent methyltransferase [Porifericola rhodea]WKN32318.1 class I SAM-dependent methyltransferase [Porifericola rhodea]
MKPPTEIQILQSWEENARRWNSLIEEDKLESRTLITNKAILHAIRNQRIQKVIDVGCGEGWLVRSLNRLGMQATGIDGSTSLVQLAKAKGGNFQHLSYQQLISGKQISGAPFELAVFNFSIFDKDGTDNLLNAIKQLLVKGGRIIIQSLHPEAVSKNSSGSWQKDVWQGLPGDFTQPYSWYLRSFNEWNQLFQNCHLQLLSTKEYSHPHTHKPLSVIFELA